MDENSIILSQLYNELDYKEMFEFSKLWYRRDAKSSEIFSEVLIGLWQLTKEFE